MEPPRSVSTLVVALGAALVLGFASPAGAQQRVVLVWSSTDNPAHAAGVGTNIMNADVGDTIGLAVRIMADVNGISSYTITLDYDTELLDLLDELSSVHNPPAGWPIFSDTSTESGLGGPAGEFAIAALCVFPCFVPVASTTVTVATITFRVKNSATSTTQLSTGGPGDDLINHMGVSLGPSFDFARVFGPTPLDSDLDTVPDLVDNCPDDANTDQANLDGDPFGDVCDHCPQTRTASNHDRGGIGAAGPDGTGDLCQNSDWNLDGTFDILDVAIGRRALAGLEMPDPALPPAPGCAVATGEEIFTPDMRGCPGTVAWASRASLCAAGWSVCSAAEWVARHGSQVPTAIYWTDDNLLHNGHAASCWADEITGTDCGGGNPMRVCSATSDAFGNDCNWTDCGYQAAPPPSQHFGGCVGNTTAGALCCR